MLVNGEAVPEKLQIVFDLMKDGMTQNEVGKKLGIAQATVGHRLQKAEAIIGERLPRRRFQSPEVARHSSRCTCKLCKRTRAIESEKPCERCGLRGHSAGDVERCLPDINFFGGRRFHERG